MTKLGCGKGLNNYEVITETGCWIWMGCLSDAGYAQVNLKGKTRQAHTASYELHRGPFPVGTEPHHTCLVRCCINPYHIAPLPYREHKALHGFFKLTDEQVAEIRRIGYTERLRVTAARFGVSTGYIGNIRAGIKR